MNKKGLAPFGIMILGIAFGTMVLLPLYASYGPKIRIAPKFRMNKAVEKCVSLGGTSEECKIEWASKTDDEILQFIRDI